MLSSAIRLLYLLGLLPSSMGCDSEKYSRLIEVRAGRLEFQRQLGPQTRTALQKRRSALLEELLTIVYSYGLPGDVWGATSVLVAHGLETALLIIGVV